MIDEHKDPGLEPVWAEWHAPPPGQEFHARVLRGFEDEFAGAARWRRRWVIAAAVAALAAAAMVTFWRPSRTPHYVPVEQPRFMVVSAGEHP